MAKFSNISRTLKQEISPDVAFVSYLAGLLRQFLAVVSPVSGAGLDGVDRSAEQYFAWLKISWERTNGGDLKNLRQLDAAEEFAVDFFAPLLDGKDIAAALTDPSVFGAEALLEVPSSSVSLQPSAPLSQASFTGPPVPNFLLVYAGAFVEIHDLLLAKGLPLDQVDAAVSLIMGSILLCSFPIWAIYHELHGYATFSKLQERLQASMDAGESVRDTVYQSVLASAPTSMPSDGIDALYVVTSIFNIIAAAFRKKNDEYLSTFANQCTLINSQRVRRGEDQTNAALKNQGFWKTGLGKGTVVNFGSVPSGTASSDVLNYIGKVIYAVSQEEGPEKLQERSFWAPQSTWNLLVKASQLISQAGFNVYVTAVDNPYAGRHPPHLTHRNGFEVDLIWTFTSDLNDVVPRLEQSKIIPGDGPFFDVTKQQFFDIAPKAGGHIESVSQFGLAKLATIVAFQAVALAGFIRYLYLDFINMLPAAIGLGLIVDPQLNPFSGGKGVIPVVEGMGHYNHLHVEAPSGKAATDYFKTKLLTIMYHLALLRDKDEDFLNSMFNFPSMKAWATPAQEQKAEAFKEDWANRSSNQLPSLLPVWVPQDVKKRLGQGEKIESVLGIGP